MAMNRMDCRHRHGAPSKRITPASIASSGRVIENSPQNSVTAVAVPHSTPIPVKKQKP